MPTLFHLVRHASTDWVGRGLAGRTPGISLNAAGRAEAEKLAARLAVPPLAAVLASPRERARETAAPIAAAHGLAVEVDAGFDEVDFGAWTGTDFADLEGRPDWRAFNTFRSTAPLPGGESAVALQARLVGALRSAAARHPDAEVAVVTHGEPVRTLLAHFLGVPLDLAHRLEVSPASRSLVVLHEAYVQVLGVNLPPGA